MIAATDLVALIGEHLELRPKGREHVGLCPFHEDSKPSFNVVTHKDRPFYNCFACGKAGSAIDFMMEYHKMSFPEALQNLAERAGIELSTTYEEPADGLRTADLREATKLAAAWYRKRLLNETVGRQARTLLETRGINEAMSEAFELGIAPDAWDGLTSRIHELEKHAKLGDGRSVSLEAFVKTTLLRPRREGNGHYDTFRNRLIFPICDEVGRPIAFGGRVISPEDEPKYLNSPENPLFDKSQTLYAFHLSKKSIIDQGHAIVVEGYTDAIACHQAGFTNVVATLGTALTKFHARRLERICARVTLIFDGDTAGQRAADRAVEVFFGSKIDLAICTLPDGEDPDGLLKQDDGKPRFQAAIDESVDVLDHLIGGFKQRFTNTKGISGRQRVIEGILDRLAGLGFETLDNVRRHLILDRIATLTGMSEKDLTRELARRKRPKPAVAAPAPAPEITDESIPYSEEEESLGALIDDHGLSDIETKPEAQRLSRRHMEAERRVLALFLFKPSLAREPIDAGEGTLLPAGEVCPATQFHHESHRLLAEQLLDAIDAGENPDVGRMILDAPDDRIGGLAAELSRMGQTLLENCDIEEVAFAGRICSELQQIAQLERFESTPNTDLETDPGSELKRRIERLKERGLDKAAIAQVARPRKPMRFATKKNSNWNNKDRR